MSQQTIGLGTVANDGTGDPIRTAFTKANGNFTELYGAVFGRVFDVTQYGAVFNGVADVSTGVQAAIDAARTFMAAGNYRSAEIVFPRGQRAILGTTLNFTGFTNIANKLLVRWSGTCLFAATNGSPAIDALGSINIYWDSVHISGQAPIPNVGIQFGRVNTTALNGGGSGMILNNCRLVDGFSLAALYSFSGESCTYINCLFANTSASSSSYCAIFDAFNHFGITSAFVTQNAPSNTTQSFNQNLLIRCAFSSGSNSQVACVWKGGCRQHEYQSCYFSAPTSGYGFLEYCIAGAGGVSALNKYDIHLEGTSTTPAGYFLFDGTLSNPVVGGFDIRVAFIYASRLFKTQGSITSMAVRNLTINMVGDVSSSYAATFQVFDNAGIWTVSSAKIDIITGSFWNYPSAQQVIVNGVPYLTADMA